MTARQRAAGGFFKTTKAKHSETLLGRQKVPIICKASRLEMSFSSFSRVFLLVMGTACAGRRVMKLPLLTHHKGLGVVLGVVGSGGTSQANRHLAEMAVDGAHSLYP